MFLKNLEKSRKSLEQFYRALGIMDEYESVLMSLTPVCISLGEPEEKFARVRVLMSLAQVYISFGESEKSSQEFWISYEKPQ